MMRFHGNAGRRPPRLALGITTTAALAMTLAACSSSAGTAGQGQASQPAPANSNAAAPATSAPQSAAAAAVSGLSGKWSGQYSGAFQGTFILRWHQSGPRLNGRITLSSPSRGTLAIHGRVAGGAIRFGTVGSESITYSGTVSGSSMSGTYQVHTPNGAVGGPWRASKS
jgi:hypothetical protein